ncbi:MAG: SDR family NAD(P)-dependent oxidoreductase [Clostridia bacterium]|nr:SDR family NAD(P)-dependent oxidoreductase [Clostridia bacterium]
MNKICVITGGTSGIGKEIANIYKQNGDTVCILAKEETFDAENYFCVDISNEEMVKTAIDKIGERFGRIDVLVNSAGFGLAGAIELAPSEDVKKEFEVNMFGTFYVNKYAIKYMPENSRIVNIASTCAMFALPYRAFYCASKAAVDIYSRCLNMELANAKIKVVSICPGDVKTNFSKNRVKIFETNERYGERITKSIQKVEGNQEKRMSPVFVAKKIVKFASKKNPKPMYIIGAKYKFLYFLSKILPQKAMLWATKKMFSK